MITKCSNACFDEPITVSLHFHVGLRFLPFFFFQNARVRLVRSPCLSSSVFKSAKSIRATTNCTGWKVRILQRRANSKTKLDNELLYTGDFQPNCKVTRNTRLVAYTKSNLKDDDKTLVCICGPASSSATAIANALALRYLRED